MARCDKCGWENPDEENLCQRCGAPLQDKQTLIQIDEKNEDKSLPMNWHNFLAYFSIWAGAVLNFFTGFSTMTGMSYGELKDQVYYTFKGIGFVDCFSGILIIALSIFGFYVAYSLLKKKKDAPKKLIELYIMGGVIKLLYNLIIALIISGKIPNYNLINSIATAVGAFLATLLFVVLNRIYYRKRAHLFVN